jgi:hypothetical protein
LKTKYKKLKHDIYEYSEDEKPPVKTEPKPVHEDLIPEPVEAPEPDEPLPPRLKPRNIRRADLLDYSRFGFS